MRLAFERALIPEEEEERERILTAAAPYVGPTTRTEPGGFFTFLHRPAAPMAVSTRARRGLPGGVATSRSFRMCYTPFDPANHEPCDENETVHVEHWTHDRPARTTVIALHGFTMGRPTIDAYALRAARWFALGLDVAMVTLPFHGPRAAATARYSGEQFGTWHVGRLNEAVRRAVHDVDLVRRWLVAENGTQVGLLGLSLGGYITSLLAGLRDDWAFAIPIAAPVCLSALPTRLAGLARGAAAPAAVAALRAAYRVHSPLAYPLRIPRRRVLVVAGRGDWIVPPEHPLALWRHWGRPTMHWYSGGHLAPFGRASAADAVEAHLARLDDDVLARVSGG